METKRESLATVTVAIGGLDRTYYVSGMIVFVERELIQFDSDEWHSGNVSKGFFEIVESSLEKWLPSRIISALDIAANDDTSTISSLAESHNIDVIVVVQFGDSPYYIEIEYTQGETHTSRLLKNLRS